MGIIAELYERSQKDSTELMMPIKAKPYEHQKKAFAFACDKFGVFDGKMKSCGTALLMEMGTGKTITSISVAGCMYPDNVTNASKEFCNRILFDAFFIFLKKYLFFQGVVSLLKCKGNLRKGKEVVNYADTRP